MYILYICKIVHKLGLMFVLIVILRIQSLLDSLILKAETQEVVVRHFVSAQALWWFKWVSGSNVLSALMIQMGFLEQAVNLAVLTPTYHIGALSFVTALMPVSSFLWLWAAGFPERLITGSLLHMWGNSKVCMKIGCT